VIVINFIGIAVLAVLIVLAILFRPFLFKGDLKGASRTQLNTAIYKEELEKLELDFAENRISLDEYNLARSEVKHRILQESEDEGVELKYRSPIKTMIAIGVFIPLLSAFLYFLVGSFADLQSGERLSPAQIQVNQMVEALEKKMEADPSDPKGWAILGRSYKVLRRPLDSEKAFDRAGAYLDGDAQLLAEYADVVALNAGGSFEGKAGLILARALKVDPNNMMALWLSGTAAYDRQDGPKAVLYWERLLKLLPANSDEAQVVRESLNEVRAKTKMPSKNYDSAHPQMTNNGQSSISGSVVLAASVQSKAKPDDVLMIIARPLNSRMPVAVKRVRVSDLPMNFVLDDSLAMSPDARISLLSEVLIEARVSKTGQAKPESGDLMSVPQVVKVGVKGIQLQIDQVRP
jgi:cytochrome c-type biogenesis protein CcmH